MHFKTIPLLGALSGPVLARSINLSSPPKGGALMSRTDNTSTAVELLADLQASAAAAVSSGASGNCTNPEVRKDWADLSTSERKNYISALQCLLTKPSQSDPNVYPGARNRYDDFVAVHLDQTLSIHGTANFLTWHRYFTWAYERALRDECGYEGYAPYWNWFTHANDLYSSPVFDGSDTSLSGDGSYVEHNGSDPVSGIHLPSGNGGGCVMKGPLTNMTVNLGPWEPTMDGMESNPDGEFAYNPRCLSRDLSSYASGLYFTYDNLHNVTRGAASGDVSAFQSEIWGRFGDLFLGMHTTGHVGVGGEASSMYTSVVDPTFFLHHAMLDRVYWIWQQLHPEQANTIAATITILNTPPSRDGQMNDTVYLSEILAPNRTISELLDIQGGSPFCYTYQ